MKYTIPPRGGSKAPSVVYIPKPCSRATAVGLKKLEHDDSAFMEIRPWLSAFWNVQGSLIQVAIVSTSQLDYALSWFMGNPTRGCSFRPLGCAL